MKKLLLLFALVAVFASCKEKSNLEAEVIAIHDEVMPKMGDMHVARKNLRKVLSSTEDEKLKSKIMEMISDLESADEGMMEWMNNWKVPENEPDKTAYLLEEKDKITKVKIDMISSLKNANSFIAKTQNK